MPVPFLVMLALLPASTPEAVNVRPELTFHVFAEFVPSVMLPDKELFPVAFNVREAAVKLEETFKAPVRVAAVDQEVAALFPDQMMFPVPALAIKFSPYVLLLAPVCTSRVIAPFAALVSRVKVRVPAISAIMPFMVIVDAVKVRSAPLVRRPE